MEKMKLRRVKRLPDRKETNGTSVTSVTVIRWRRRTFYDIV